tara:strand:- start:2591 stop:2896 length:306 start_codon:yes stop_codon:yes gene_type:complete
MSDLYWLTDAQMARLEPFFPKPHGKPRVDDRRVLSGMRHRIENAFARLKDWRRVATRYDRCPKVYLSACALAAVVSQKRSDMLTARFPSLESRRHVEINGS